jgi:selenocysteine lyase/cysteine desulfurase
MVEELEPPFLDVRSARWLDATHYTVCPGARRFETWEGSRAGKLALGVAADYATGWGLEDIKRRDDELASRLRERVGGLPGAKILDLGPQPCAIVSFAIEGIAPDVLKAALGAKRINVSVSTAEDTLLDMSARGYESWIRASVHYFNSEQEVDQLIDELYLIVHSAR